jgi:hypothetical protein
MAGGTPPCFPRRGRTDRPYRTHPLPPPTAAPAIPTSEGRGRSRREQPFPEVSVGPLRRGGPQRPYGFLRAVVLAPRLRRQDRGMFGVRVFFPKKLLCLETTSD